MLKPLKTKIADLPDAERKTMRAIIRLYIKSVNGYAAMHKQGIGLEQTEEACEELVNKGVLVIRYDEDEDGYIVEPYFN